MPFSLHLSPSTPAIPSSPSFSSSGKHRTIFYGASRPPFYFDNYTSSIDKRRESCATRCSMETVGPVVGEVTEVNNDTFWPIVKAAGEKIVVLDMYTQWCGPCKIIAPKYQELSKKYTDVVFLKLDCSQENKALAKELGIRVVPTFKILKDNQIVKEVRGAKFDDLVLAIDTARSS